MALLDNWSRAQAKVELLDLFFAERGLIDEHGELRGPVAVYFTALNSASRTLTKLGAHLRDATTDPVRELNDYLASRDYVDDNDGDGDPAA
ncbi:MAG: hypothetical protein ABI990_11080 [Actinomycetota bacterium]